MSTTMQNHAEDLAEALLEAENAFGAAVGDNSPFSELVKDLLRIAFSNVHWEAVTRFNNYMDSDG